MIRHRLNYGILPHFSRWFFRDCFFSCFLFSFFIVRSEVKAQYSFSRFDSIPVSVFDTTLANPWAGGLNFPQFSPINLDGHPGLDLFIFDRTGNKILTFLNAGIADSVSYSHAPEFQSRFPYMTGWALLADYNYDGESDLFTSNPKGGVMVYRNDFTSQEGLVFSVADSLLTSSFGANIYDVYVSPWDIPAICDIDEDGDLDILSFDAGGMRVTYYKNISRESFGIPDSLIYTIEDLCWGKFEEAFGNCDITLGLSCREASVKENTENAKHAGSTLLALDLDGDNDKELLLGDLICNKIVQLTNGGTVSAANMTGIDTQYPPDYSAKINLFPAAFYLDVDNDGAKDLLAAPSALNISENFRGIWFYKNTGTNAIPQFEFRSKSFLQNTMIELGEGANGSFFDADSDSLMDLVIGNQGYYKQGENYLSELSLFKNTGSKTNPSFELVTRDYLGISSLGLTGVHPCFGDIDDDGDADLLLGESKGELYLFINTAPAGAPASFATPMAGYQGIDVGQYSAPQLVDVNRDGKIDMLVGERNGNLNYFENTGTATEAEFTLATDSFGKINILEEGAVSAYSVPKLVELDTLPDYVLLVGSESGKIFLYRNIENNLTGSFVLEDSSFMNIQEGTRTTIDFSDITNDGNPDLLVGNYRGGIALFKNNAPPRELKSEEEIFVLKLFPNPSSGSFHIEIPEIINSAEFILYNMLGEKVVEFRISAPGKYLLNTTKAPGVYFARLTVDGSIVFKEKVIFLR